MSQPLSLSGYLCRLKYFGSYAVGERIGEVAYLMDLPAGWRIHPVFRITKLRKTLGATERAQEIPAQLTEDVVWVTETHYVEELRESGKGTCLNLKLPLS